MLRDNRIHYRGDGGQNHTINLKVPFVIFVRKTEKSHTYGRLEVHIRAIFEPKGIILMLSLLLMINFSAWRLFSFIRYLFCELDFFAPLYHGIMNTTKNTFYYSISSKINFILT